MKHPVSDTRARDIAEALIQAVGADPSQIEDDTVTVEWIAGSESDDAVVRWVGRATLPWDTVAKILEQIP
jgi:hypothetical protein